MTSQRGNNKGFTLIELLVVIGIVGILAAVVMLVLDPVEYLRRSRDANRITDIQAINESIKFYEFDGNTLLGVIDTLYISLPDATSTSCASLTLPALPGGWSYACVSEASLRNIDSSGWIPINFTVMTSGSILAKLPIDPVNSDTDTLYYTYTSDGSWELTARLESEQFGAGGSIDSVSNDGGDDDTVFEYGTNLMLTPTSTVSATSSASSVTTNSASNPAATSTTLNGTANPNGDDTTGWFRYSATDPGDCSDSFGTRVPSSGGDSLGSGTNNISFSENLTGIYENTAYYYCALASNSNGTATGTVKSFISDIVRESNLVTYLRFDDGSGTTAADSSGNGNSGTLTNNPIWETSDCKSGYCLDFDGSNDYVTLGTKSAFDLTTYTITGWFKTSNRDDYRVITQKATGWNTRNWWIPIWKTTGAVYWRETSGGVLSIDMGTGENNADGVWHHFAAAVEENVIAKLYVDGVLKATDNTPGTPDTPSEPVLIGSQAGSSRFFDGIIDDFRIYNAALSTGEIQAIYDAIN